MVNSSTRTQKPRAARPAASRAPSLKAKPRAEDGDEKVVIQIPAHPKHLRLVRLAAAAAASQLDFSIEDIEDIKLAVAEACNNAILHAPPARSGRLPIVTITLVPLSDRLEIRVEDEGRLAGSGLPRRKTRDALPDGVLPEGGLGLLIIESLMDEVQHLTGLESNTTLRMVKYLRGAVRLR